MPAAIKCVSEQPSAANTGPAWHTVSMQIFSGPAPTYGSQNCYDYAATVGYTLSTPYSFVANDYACNGSPSRVYKCLNSNLCNTTVPNTDIGQIWALQRSNPNSIQPPLPPNCFTYSSTLNYLPGDRVCTTQPQSIWACKDLPYGLQCASVAPTPLSSNNAWNLVTLPVSLGSAPTYGS